MSDARRLMEVLLVVLDHLIDPISNGEVFGNDFHPGKFLLSNIASGNDSPHLPDEGLPFSGEHVIDEDLSSVRVRRLCRKCEGMNVFRNKRERSSIDGSTALFVTQYLRVIRKTAIEFSGGNHL